VIENPCFEEIGRDERADPTRGRRPAGDGDVDERIYDGIGHGVVEDELDAAAAIVDDARADGA